MIVEQQRLNGFHHLLDLECVPHPPAKPHPHIQWVSWPSACNWVKRPAKVQGWLLHIPGICEPEFFTSEERANARHAYLTSLMKARSYLGVVDGHLFDFRPAIPQVLRFCYEHLCSDIRTGRQLAATLRAIDKLPLKEHAYLTTAVGGALCPACVRQEMVTVVSAMRNHNDFEYWVTGWSVNYEEVGNHLTCDHCHREIPTVPQ